MFPVLFPQFSTFCTHEDLIQEEEQNEHCTLLSLKYLTIPQSVYWTLLTEATANTYLLVLRAGRSRQIKSVETDH